MDTFEWIEEIQKVYEDLIDSSKNVNLKEIEDFRQEQDNKFENFVTTINVLVNTALGNLAVAIDTQTNTFEKSLDEALKNIEVGFRKNLPKLQKIIIKKLGIDF
ncbi:MAG: hypothetical protein ACFE91_02455 [Promethearchaeota archaeon]